MNHETETDSQPGNRALEQRSRELFNDRVANLNARTRSRLNQARQAALIAAGGESRSLNSRWLLPVGSAAALALVSVLAVQLIRPNDESAIEASTAIASAVDDVEILTSSDELEMLQDVDFYAWLDTQQTGQDSLSAGGGASEAG